MFKNALGLLSYAASATLWMARKTIEAWFFDRAAHAMIPGIDIVLQYGPPVALLIAGTWLLWPEIERRTGGLRGASARRMGLIELLAVAQKKGIDFTTMEFTRSLRQAGVDGEIKFFGKPKHGAGFDILVDGEPLRAIDSDEWLRYKIDRVGILDGNGKLSTDNRKMATYDMSDICSTDGYVDVHVDRRQALRWLAKRR